MPGRYLGALDQGATSTRFIVFVVPAFSGLGGHSARAELYAGWKRAVERSLDWAPAR